MKNKIYFSLAMIIAANAFVAIPASALTFEKAVKVTAKTTLGIAALGATSLLTARAFLNTAVGAPLYLISKGNMNQWDSTESAKVLFLCGSLWFGALSGGYITGKILNSAWNEIQDVNQ